MTGGAAVRTAQATLSTLRRSSSGEGTTADSDTAGCARAPVAPSSTAAVVNDQPARRREQEVTGRYFSGSVGQQHNAAQIRAEELHTDIFLAPMSTSAPSKSAKSPSTSTPTSGSQPARPGRFGEFGGRYVSEILMPSLDELTAAWDEAARDRGVPGRAGSPAARLRRPAHAAGRGTPAERRGQPGGRAGCPPVPQARGPVPHRRAQDQQLHRPGAAGQAHGQDPDHRRDRGRPARRGHRQRLRPVRAALRGLHGRGGRRAPGAERVPHEAAGRQGPPGQERHRHAEGRDERGAARLGHQRARHPLRHRLGGRPAPVSRRWCAICRR